MVLQIVDQPGADLAVPETNYTFDTLIKAQALGDFTALKQRRRRALRVDLGGDTAGGLKQLADALRSRAVRLPPRRTKLRRKLYESDH